MKIFEDGENMRIFIAAGEPSGDVLGWRLMKCLRSIAPSRNFEFVGVGGFHMQKDESFHSIFPMEEISVMGLLEVVPHIRNIQRRIKYTAAEAERLNPDAIVTIDAKGFNFRLLQTLKTSRVRSVPRIHYVSPSIWAYRHRDPIQQLRNLKPFIDHTLAILPFEQKYYDVAEASCTFVGHPAIDSLLDGQFFRPGVIKPISPQIQTATSCNDGGLLNWDKEIMDPLESGCSLQQFQPAYEDRIRSRKMLTGNNDTILAIFPGSRKSELSRSLHVIENVLKAVHRDVDTFVIPCTNNCIDGVQSMVDKVSLELGNKRIIVSSEDEVKKLAFSGAACALAVSGTVVTELSAYGIPTVVMYDANLITGIIAKRIANVRYVSVPNIIHDEQIIPEYLFENCRAEAIIPAIKRLIHQYRENTEGTWYPEQIQKLDSILPQLCRWGVSEKTSLNKSSDSGELDARPIRPSIVAAKTIISIV